ncbi:catechol 1,2-dioxygenase [Pseudomonas sp. M47T1]|nr:catechol 1,2-dioxygenase [Pseudomonas sp. M47T1]
MKNFDEHTITQAVLARNAETDDARLHEIMAGLIQHLHDFARETQLTEEEWDKGIQFLTAVGQICSPLRQEFILHSDTLGLSTLVTAQNNRKPEGCTEATVFGPFHVPNAPHFDLGADISEGLPGTPWFVRTHVRDIHGKPVARPTVEVWQADDAGFYDVQKPELGEATFQGRAVLQADA